MVRSTHIHEIRKESENLCPDCNGTGRNEKRTLARVGRDADFRHRARHHGTYVRCWNCHGNGPDPAAFFSWGKTADGIMKRAKAVLLTAAAAYAATVAVATADDSNRYYDKNPAIIGCGPIQDLEHLLATGWKIDTIETVIGQKDRFRFMVYTNPHNGAWASVYIKTGTNGEACVVDGQGSVPTTQYPVYRGD